DHGIGGQSAVHVRASVEDTHMPLLCRRSRTAQSALGGRPILGSLAAENVEIDRHHTWGTLQNREDVAGMDGMTKRHSGEGEMIEQRLQRRRVHIVRDTGGV